MPYSTLFWDRRRATMKNLKTIVRAGAVAVALGLGSALIGAGVKDTDGNLVQDNTDWGDVDGRATTVADIKELIAPGYSNLVNQAANAATKTEVTNVVREVVYDTNRYIFDARTGVCYYMDFWNDYITYIAITNVDVRLPQNVEALKACDEIVRNLH